MDDKRDFPETAPKRTAGTRPMPRLLAGFTILLAACAAPGRAAETGVPSHFESLTADTVYRREGPRTEHRVKWVYRRKGLPMEVLGAYDVWRRVRDMDGEIGWIHVALLSRDRTALIAGTALVPVRAREDSTSALVARVEPGVIAAIENCGPVACRLDFSGIEGWVDRSRLWGVYGDEHL
jgi:SH3-like domain-containing protein